MDKSSLHPKQRRAPYQAETMKNRGFNVEKGPLCRLAAAQTPQDGTYFQYLFKILFKYKPKPHSETNNIVTHAIPKSHVRGAWWNKQHNKPRVLIEGRDRSWVGACQNLGLARVCRASRYLWIESWVKDDGTLPTLNLVPPSLCWTCLLSISCCLYTLSSVFCWWTGVF